MNAKELLKMTAVAIFTTGFAVGCASSGSSGSSGSESTAEPEAVVNECEGASPEAKNAIYAAKLKNARARNLGFESGSNEKMIEAAEKAGADCNDVRAVSLAKRSEGEADKFIAKYHADQAAAEAAAASVVEAPVVESEAESMYIGNYLVEKGDNLWNIAGQNSIYGNPYQWPLIYKANNNQIDDADLIFPGQNLKIPKAKAGESAAAIRHAKNRGAWVLGEVENSDIDYLVE